MENIIQLLTYLIIVSTATERFVEIIRATPVGKILTKAVHFQILAAVFGAILCYIEPPQFNIIHLNQYVLIIIIGLSVSGGSGVWHDILEVIKNYNKQLKTQATV
jgi:hypothetical protein